MTDVERLPCFECPITRKVKDAGGGDDFTVCPLIADADGYDDLREEMDECAFDLAIMKAVLEARLARGERCV